MSGYWGHYEGSPPPYSDDEDEEMRDAPEYDQEPMFSTFDENQQLPGAGANGKAKRTAKTIPKKCRTCGNAGHDSRNCAMNKGFESKKKKKQAEAPPPPPPPPPPHDPTPAKIAKASKATNEKACGACREVGHDRRSCPALGNKPGQEEKLETFTKAIQNLAESLAAPSSNMPTPKTKTTKATEPTPKTKQTARSSRGKAAKVSSKVSVAPVSPAPVARSGITARGGKQTAKRGGSVSAATSGRGSHVSAAGVKSEPIWQMEPEAEKQVRPLQTARRSKPFSPLGTRGSKAGGVTKKTKETTAKKKAASNISKALLDSINLTINLL
ncbi:hypothetical protein H072_4167 [Dactylellina haptotyla CBS 200.50]|uniref:CCHC-type domain-containing protein n=1 Tax=Dactylellina haptotyla (strain CBS 200.50) TaxID=1284197 RepID=S8ALC3_DACHA|nr:hypothetical protein H072_4167 [Dactylellina haptotyla CBS 200.50]